VALGLVQAARAQVEVQAVVPEALEPGRELGQVEALGGQALELVREAELAWGRG